MPTSRKVTIESVTDREDDPLMNDRLEIAGAKGYIDLDRDATELSFALDQERKHRWQDEFVVGPPGSSSQAPWTSVRRTEEVETVDPSRNIDTDMEDEGSSTFTDIISGTNFAGSGTGITPSRKRK